MQTRIKEILLEALDTKEASLKRAKHGAKPAFAAVYEVDLASCAHARAWIKDQPIDDGKAK